MTPEGIGGGFGEPPKDVGGKENFSVPEDVGRQDDKEVVNSGVESGEKSEEVLVGDKTEALAGEAPTSSKEGDLEPAKDGTVGIEKEVSSEEETEVLTGEVFTPGKDGSLEPVSKNGSVIDFSKKEPVVKEEGESAPKHGDVVFEDKEEYPEDAEEEPREKPEDPHHKERGETVNKIKDLLIESGFLTPTDEQKDRMAESMEGVFKVLGHKVKSVSEMDNIIRDFEEKGNRSSYSAVQAENMRTDRQILSEAVSLAADDLTRDNLTLAGHFYLGSKHVDNMMDSSLTGLGWEISKRFIGNRSIDKRLNILEITRKGVDMADESSRKTYLQKLELTIERLGKDEFEDDSDVIQQDAALANLYSEKKFLETVNNGYNNNPDDGYGYAAEDPSEAVEVETDLEEVTEPDITDVDGRAIIENLHGDGKEYRSPYEVTPVSFVDSCFNGENPRLFFTPAPGWVEKMSSIEKYLLKIQQKLAKGAEYKMGVQSIDAAKARQNEAYNLPTTELKLIYEMPYVREAMETFVSDLFEFYSEDGRQYLRLKLSKKDGVLEMKNGKPVLDKDVAKKVGDIETGGGFEDYKEEMFKTMALKRLYPARGADIISSWKSVYDEVVRDYQVEARKNPRNKNKTDAELEHEWVSKNALEEKRAVATAWNFLYLGNIIESADIYRHLKPTQIGADKIRTMFRPGEKGLQKGGLRGESLSGSEEGFGRGFLYMKRMSETLGKDFMDKVVKALDNDRQNLSKEELQWRFLPKRMMCGFSDMYVVETEDGDHMTFSEALMYRKKMVFKNDDADVFVYLRDVWDEVITVTPFLIGKAEYTPLQQPDKFASAIEKWRGLVTGYENIRITDPKEIDRRRSEMIKKKVPEDKLWKANFGHGVAVDAPELYAWLLANTIGLNLNFDIPVLDMAAMKVDKETYDVGVNELIRLMDLTPGQASEVKRILNAQGWRLSRNAIRDATRRAEKREGERRRFEKRN